MTTTDPQTVSAFLAAIAAEPDNDMPRLALADYLEENGEADRGEFIRLQCRIARLQHGCWCAGCRPDGQHHNGPCAVDRERDELPDGRSKNAHLRHRCNELLFAHPEWSRLPCPECGGRGEMVFAEMPPMSPLRAVLMESAPEILRSAPSRRGHCPACDGTGDLLRRRYEPEEFPEPGDDPDKPKLRTVRFRRGFIDSVSCEHLEVLGPTADYTCLTCHNRGYIGSDRRLCPVCSGGAAMRPRVVRPWARAILKACPTITRLMPSDYHAPNIEHYAEGLVRQVREAIRES